MTDGQRSPTSDGQIVVSGLTKQYKTSGRSTTCRSRSQPGRVTGFLGPNGAGKTTTLRMLLDLVMPTAGTATIGGLRYADLPEPLRSRRVLEASGAHKGRTGRTICGSSAPRRAPRQRAPTRCSTWSG